MEIKVYARTPLGLRLKGQGITVRNEHGFNLATLQGTRIPVHVSQERLLLHPGVSIESCSQSGLDAGAKGTNPWHYTFNRTADDRQALLYHCTECGYRTTKLKGGPYGSLTIHPERRLIKGFPDDGVTLNGGFSYENGLLGVSDEPSTLIFLIGYWLGITARYILEHFPEATVLDSKGPCPANGSGSVLYLPAYACTIL